MADFGEQAFLLDFINYFPNFTTAEGTKDVETDNYHLILDETFPSFQYDHVMRVQGNPESSINKLSINKYKPSKEFNNFKPHQLSYLTPRIEIYKTRRVGKKWIEIPFPINAVTTAESITNSLEGRGTDVALKSISWQDTGTDTAYAGITMKGNIQLTFQSFESLFMDRPTDFGDETIGFYELTTNVPSNRKTDSPISDVQMSRIDGAKADSGAMVQLGGTPFEIKIVVGWSVPDDQNNEIFKPYELDAIRDSVSVLNVTTNRCDITIGNGGKVDLTCEFTGRLETAMYTQKYDLFMIDTTSMEGQVRENSIKATSDIKNERAKLEAEDNIEKRSDVETELEKIKDLTTNTLYSLQSKSIQDAWSGFLSGISNMKTDDGKNNGRIWSVSITREMYDKYATLLKLRKEFLNIQHEALLSQEDESGGVATVSDEILKQYDSERQNARDSLMPFLLDSARLTKENKIAAAAAIRNVDNTKGEEAHKKSLALALEGIRTSGNGPFEEPFGPYQAPGGLMPQDTELFKVNFFFLGDLFESAMNIIINRPDSFGNCKPPKGGKANPNSKTMADDARLLLGTINLTNPDNGTLKTINIADIPISVNSFLKWFEKTIVIPSVTALPLRKFLSSVATSLVSSVLGLQAENRATYRSPSSKIKLATLELPEDGLIDVIWKSDKYRKEISIDQVMDAANKRGDDGNDGKTLRTRSFLYLYTNELPRPPNKASAIYQVQQNLKAAIPHLYVGNNDGIVKKVTFTRTPIVGHRESSILRSKREGITFKSQLLSSDKYDITLLMYGNPFYKPGMQIYLDPQSLGLGYSVKPQWARDLGLGGHYSVIGVENSIKAGHYETKIAAKTEVGLGLKSYTTPKSSHGGYGNNKIDK